MRILFLSNLYPPYEVGGLEQNCRDCSVMMEERGHSTFVLTSDRGVRHKKIKEEPNVFRILRLSPDYESGVPIIVQFWILRRKIERHNIESLHRTVNEFKPDIIFIWNIQGLPRNIAVEAESQPGVAVAYWLAGYSPAEPDEYSIYWAGLPRNKFLRMLWPLLRLPAQAKLRQEGKPIRPKMFNVGVVSEYMRNKGIKEGTLPSHAQVIYNGVEIDQFYRQVPSPEDQSIIRILYAGRVSHDKGVHTVVEAISHLAKKQTRTDFHLLIAGGGPTEYRNYLEDLISRNRIEEKVTLVGQIPRERMPDLMKSCHVLVLPTIHQEPFARVVLEGMAAGLAVVATLTGGTGELLQNEYNGLAFAANDSKDLCKQLYRLIEDPSLRFCLAKQGQEMVLKDFTLERMVDRLELLLLQAKQEYDNS